MRVMAENLGEFKLSSGYIKWWRKVTEKWYWPTNEKRPFTRYEAWMDMALNLAQGTDTDRLKRGQFETSYSFLAKRWTWPRSKVRRFLAKLSKDEIRIAAHLPTQQATQQSTQVTIRNYNKLNPLPTHLPAHLPTQQATPNKERRKKEEIKIRPTDFPRMVFAHWQRQEFLRTHREFTPGMRTAINNRKNKGYSPDQIMRVVTNYGRLGEHAPGWGKWGIVELMTTVKQFDNLLDDDWQGFTGGPRNNGDKPTMDRERDVGANTYQMSEEEQARLYEAQRKLKEQEQQRAEEKV